MRVLNVSDEVALTIIRERSHLLITPAELARRTGRTRGAISNWQNRRPDFTELTVAANLTSTTIYWWPAVREWLTAQRIPFGEPCERTGRHCLSCGSGIQLGELIERIERIERI
jgi:hypothetical protein